MHRALHAAVSLIAAALIAACGGGGEDIASKEIAQSVPTNHCAVDAARMAEVLSQDADPGPIDGTPVLQAAFSDPVATPWLLEGPIHSMAGIRAANDGIFMLAEGFEHSFDCIEIGSATQVTDPSSGLHAVRVAFTYQGRPFTALAYGSLPLGCHSGGAAALIIPGSGLNQSQAIVGHDPANAHYGVMDALATVPNIYTFVKPNEDSLAWHDGSGRKLSGHFIWNYHVNRGGSYSVSYLVQSLAFVKWMKDCYSTTVVAGVSQGGAATMLNALQSKPTMAIVAAGHSLLFDLVEYAGTNQLINVEGYARLAKPDQLVQALSTSPTRWLFAWGRADGDVYKIEADTGYTASFIQALPNVSVAIHDGGHVFPVDEIHQFLGERVGP